MKKNLSPTELPSIGHEPIDKTSPKEALKLLLESQKMAVSSVSKNLDLIELYVDSIFNHLKYNTCGRLIYVGAGTSGRIAVQDGVELYPTFGWPKSRVDYILAGGSDALTSSIENAEDNIYEGIKTIKKMNINKNDVVIGLAASGNTPFTNSVLKEIERIGSFTIGITNNPNATMLKFLKNYIVLDTGPEVVEGSTRLKAGTSQKICLNLISTLLMIKLGKVLDGKMINLVANNKKLKDRKKRIEDYLNK